MRAIYPNDRQPSDGWFWSLFLGWLATACLAALVGWMVVSAIAESSGDQAVAPRTDVSPPSVAQAQLADGATENRQP